MRDNRGMPGEPGGREAVAEANATLLAAAAAGDQAAWDALVARFTNLLCSVASGYRLKVGEDADAVQNTWLRLVENLDRLSRRQASIPRRAAGCRAAYECSAQRA